MKKCNLCNKPDKLHYRVKSIIHKNWIFCCKECWNIISKQNGYSYGGTRKSKWKIIEQTKLQQVKYLVAYNYLKFNLI